MLSVLDSTDARIPHVVVHVERVTRDGDGPQVTMSAGGDWMVAELPEGQYRVRIGAAGFRSIKLLRTVRPSRPTRLVVRLALEPVQETVTVSRDPQTSALDRRGFSTFLSRELIDMLPDDPEEFVRVLRDMAPPGAIIRIDGFAGGPMPPKAQILSVRIPRLDAYPAQEHGGLNGGGAIDIVTRPGGGDLQGTGEITARHSAFTARNPLADSKPAARTTTAGFTMDGPIVRDKVSFALSSRLVARSETAVLQAALGDGSVHRASVGQPGSLWLTAGRLAMMLPAGHSLRAAVSTEQRSHRRLGVGDYNLEDRAFDSAAFDTLVRLTSGGPWGSRRYVESRMQLRWSGARNIAAVETPTVRVLGAFTSGGAQNTGGARSFELQAATDVDVAVGPHAWRTGVLVDSAGYRANRRSNYLGTYTFASLADYQDGSPAFYTVRTGDARIAYRDVQAAAYVQDDFRVRRSLLLSYGARVEWQSLLAHRVAVLPRAAVTWSPSDGTPSLRVSWGRFREWFPVSVYEPTLLLDGQRQVDFRVQGPTFPVSTLDGAAAPRERVGLDQNLQPTTAQRLSVGVEHQVLRGMRVSAVYAVTRGAHLLRGRNLNPSIASIRADSLWGNVVESVGDAQSRTHTLTAQLIVAPRSRWFDASVSYLFNRSRANTAGPFSVPPAARSLAEEWGAVGARHALTGSMAMRLAAFSLTLMPRWHSGQPYTLTTADADDGFFTTRPAGVARNSETTPAQFDMGLRIAFAIHPKGRSVSGETPTLASAPGSRRRLELFASVQNVTNYPNYAVIGSVVGTPLFGKPLAAGTPRSLDVGVRVGF